MKRQAFVVAVAVLLACLGGAPPAAAQGRHIAAAVASASALRVDAFDVEQVAQLGPGTPLHFSLYGSAGGQATVRIDGASRAMALQEMQAGIYEGTYVVAAADHIAPDSRVTADLWLAGQSTSVVLEEPLMLGAPSPRPCADCAVVENIRTVEERERPGVVGTLAGGVVGAILGSQVGKGDGRTLGGILGAVGGAVVGREIERSRSQRIRYEVAVRGPDGLVQMRRYDAPPPFRVGDRVRVAGGAWLPEPTPAMP